MTRVHKDSPGVGDVHVAAALGNEGKKRRWRDFSSIIGASPKPKEVRLPEERGPATNTEDGPEGVTVKRKPVAFDKPIHGHALDFRLALQTLCGHVYLGQGTIAKGFNEVLATYKVYHSTKDLPKAVRGKLTGKKRRQWMHVFNSILADHPGDEARAFAGAWSTSQKTAAISGKPMVGVGGRRLEPYDADTFFVPIKHDPYALAYMREDQVPRVLDALTHSDRLPEAVVDINDLMAVKNRVRRESIEKHFARMRETPGTIVQRSGAEHVEGRDDLKPATVAWMNGQMYLLDGHDRVAAIWLNGGDQIRVLFADVDAYDDDKPDPDDVHEGIAYDLLQGVEGRQLTNYRNGTLNVPFMYDPNFFSHLRPDQVPRFTFALTHPEELDDAMVPLASLVAIQNRVNADTVTAKVEKPSKKLPVIVRMNGTNYIGDGHDRLSAAWLRGEDSAPVKVADITFETNSMVPGVQKALSIQITKTDPDKRQVFGWASVCTVDGEHVVDKQDDIVPVSALEPAVYEYVLSSRDGGDMHVERGVSRLIESMMFSKEKQDALGINLGMEGWFVGYQVDSPQVWDAVKRGERPEFSIGGAAMSVPYETWKEQQ